MSNSLSFILKLQDTLSPALRTAVKVVDSAESKINSSVKGIAREWNQTTSSIKGSGFASAVGNQVDASIARLKGLKNQLRSTKGDIDNIKPSGGSGGGGFGIGSFIKGGLIAGAISMGASVIMGGIGDTIGAAMDFGKTKKSFQVLAGDAVKGDALAGELNKLQQDTILGPSVFKNAQTMMGFGIAVDKVVPTLKQLGDVSMGDEEKLSGLTLAFSQVQATGKLMGQDLLQMINAGFNPLNEISRTTGKSMGELKAMMEKGQISSGMISEAFRTATSEGGLYNNMLNTLAETPAGKMAQLSGAWDTFKVKIGEALMPLAEIGMQLGNTLIPIAQQYLPYISEAVSWLIAGFTELMNPTGQFGWYMEYVQTIVGVIWNVLSYVGQKIWAIVGSIVEWLAKSEIIQDVFWLIGKIAGVVGEVVKGIADVLLWIWDNIVKPVLDSIEWVYKKIKGLFGGSNKAEVAVTQTVKAAEVPGLKAIPGGKMPVTPTTANGAGGANLNVNAGKEKAEGINSGGQRSIVINIGKQIEKLEVHTMSTTQSAEEIGAIVIEQMRRVMYSLNSATGS
jgi:tape measure domain-containing protein